MFRDYAVFLDRWQCSYDQEKLFNARHCKHVGFSLSKQTIIIIGLFIHAEYFVFSVYIYNTAYLAVYRSCTLLFVTYIRHLLFFYFLFFLIIEIYVFNRYYDQCGRLLIKKKNRKKM